MKVAVMGAGAVGSYYGAMLARAGHAVTLIGRPAHVEAVRTHGLMFESSAFHGRIAMQATTEPSGVADADVVLFCVKSTDTENAGRAIAPFLKPDTTVLCLQNGVDNATRLQAIIAPTAVPAVVYVASEMIGPGHIRHHGRGELIIGPSPASDAIAARFIAAAIPTTVSAHVADALWVKLVTNCAYNALSAVGEMSYGPLLATAGVAEIMRSVVAECRAVASAAGVALPADIAEQVLGLAATMPDQYSSTAQDLRRGKPTEIDHLNGYVTRAGAALGIPTPVNLALQVIVKLREARQAASVPRS
jgi:2-dehydropantoate 2-reductase